MIFVNVQMVSIVLHISKEFVRLLQYGQLSNMLDHYHKLQITLPWGNITFNRNGYHFKCIWPEALIHAMWLLLVDMNQLAMLWWLHKTINFSIIDQVSLKKVNCMTLRTLNCNKKKFTVVFIIHYQCLHFQSSQNMLACNS